MLYSCVVASLILAGVSAAHLQHNLTDPQPIQAATSNSTYYYIAPNGTLSSSHGQPSPTARLSKREDPPSDEDDWVPVATKAIGEGAEVIDNILDHIFDKDKTTFVTIISTSTLTTSSEEPDTTTVTQDPVTITVVPVPTPPGETVTTTVDPVPTPPGETVTTTVNPVPPPGATETVLVPVPAPPSGCYHVSPDGKLAIGDC